MQGVSAVTYINQVLANKQLEEEMGEGGGVGLTGKNNKAQYIGNSVYYHMVKWESFLLSSPPPHPTPQQRLELSANDNNKYQ